MAPKKRLKENKGYPKRWRWRAGSWRYQVPKGREAQWDGKVEFTLGKTDTEAYKVWSDRLQLQVNAQTIGDLMERYEQQVVPAKSYKAKESNRTSLRRLRQVFGAMQLRDIKPSHIYKYVDHMGDRRTSAFRDVEVIRHAYTKAVEWGLLDRHPLLHQLRFEDAPGARDRYVTDPELTKALIHANPTIRAYIAIKLLTGLRRGDILRLKLQDLEDDGIHVKPHKTAKTTGKRLIIEWSDELRTAVDEAKEARPKDIAPFLFCTRKGKPYVKPNGTANAFDSLWQRFMRKVTAAGVERFQERDLRAKTASDMPLELASALLGHADVRTTLKHYRRRGEKVKPLR